MVPIIPTPGRSFEGWQQWLDTMREHPARGLFAKCIHLRTRWLAACLQRGISYERAEAAWENRMRKHP